MSLAKPMLAAALVLVTVMLIVIGIVHRPTAPEPFHVAAGGGTAVSGGGVTLVSTSVALPATDPPFPAGAGVLDANCTACHSASMVLAQPPLKPEQWKATLTKMREAYKAPIAERDVPAILAALSALDTQRAAVPAS